MIEIVDIEAKPLIAVQGHVQMSEIPDKIMPMLNRILEYAGERGIPEGYQSVWVYHDRENDGFDVDIGVLVDAPMETDGDVVMIQTPGGRAVHTVHTGPYDQIGSAHQSIFGWCRENGHERTGDAWEVYGEWHDDPAKLRTDIYHLLK